MRDDQVASNDRETAERNNANRPSRGADDPASPGVHDEESPSDVPTALSGTSHPADIEEAGLSDEEILMYRRRVAEGLYNSREVADEVARRMLKRGDI